MKESRHKTFLKKVEGDLLQRKLRRREYPIIGKAIKMYNDDVLNNAIEISKSLSTTNMVKTFLAVCSSIANKEKANKLLDSIELLTKKG